MILMAFLAQFPEPPSPPEPPSFPSPPSIYYPAPPPPKPIIRFDQPFTAPIQTQKEQRFISPEGKLVTCRTHGQTVYCF